MGSVYKAVHAHLQRPVALKLLPANLARNPAAVERFRQEMIAVGKLDHPNIVRAHDADIVDGHMFLVMELISGVDLGRLIRKRGAMSIEWACRLTRQAALGLHYAHQHGLVHRDIKPSNMMISKDGDLKILDLGLALLVSPDANANPDAEAPAIMGTADFMAPEQGVNSDLVDARSDIYSLGCTLYALLAGKPPFASDHPQTFFQKAKAHRTELVPPLSGVRSDVPPVLLDVLNRMLAKRPEDRIQSAEEVAMALEPFLSDLRVIEPPPVPAQPVELPPMFVEYDAHVDQRGHQPGRLRRVLRRAGIAAILAVGVGIVFAMQQPVVVEYLHSLFAPDVSNDPVKPVPTPGTSPPIVIAQGPPVGEPPDPVKPPVAELPAKDPTPPPGNPPAENPVVPQPEPPPTTTVIDHPKPVVDPPGTSTNPEVKPPVVQDQPGDRPVIAVEVPKVKEQPLFNGRDLTGWEYVPLAYSKNKTNQSWRVDRGQQLLYSTGVDSNDLRTTRTYRNFVLRLNWRFTPGGSVKPNGTGVIVRANGLDAKGHNPKGIEIDMRLENHYERAVGTGCLIAYETPMKNRFGQVDGVTKKSLGAIEEVKLKGKGEWNEVEIRCEGDRLRVVMNGVLVNEATDIKASEGTICLRNQMAAVQFKDIRIQILPD
ncbi:MAG: family 16 glycoside hydrolase [Phycisphaeraceae bacterium]